MRPSTAEWLHRGRHFGWPFHCIGHGQMHEVDVGAAVAQGRQRDEK